MWRLREAVEGRAVFALTKVERRKVNEGKIIEMNHGFEMCN